MADDVNRARPTPTHHRRTPMGSSDTTEFQHLVTDPDWVACDCFQFEPEGTP